MNTAGPRVLRKRFGWLVLALGVSGTGAQGQLRQVGYIKASAPHANDHFGNGGALEGHALAMSGDRATMAVGAPYESSAARGVNGKQDDTSLYSAGAVYVYTRRNNVWTQQAYLKASNPGQSFRFGHMVALSQDGNTLAVASHFEASAAKGVNGNQDDRSIPQAGALYVFTRTGGTWRQEAYLKASNTGEPGVGKEPPEGDQFGFSIALSADGNTIAAGSISEDSAAAGVNGNQADNSKQSSGAAYVFVRNGGVWTQQAYIKASNPEPNTLFGYSVGLSADGNTLAVSSYDEAGSARTINGPQDRGRRGSGAVYVFARTAQTWAQSAYLKAANADQGDSMGYEIAISNDGNTIAAGAADEDCLNPGVNPAGCVDDFRSDTSAGAVYVFSRNPRGQWTQQAYLKASNPGHENWFGARLALSGDGDSLAAGSQVENGAAKGINGNQKDQSAEDAGALYLFTRSAGTWSQKAYVKASNAEAYDEFGSSMALSRDGKLLVVGARGEASAAKGANGSQEDNSAPGAGAVYVFTSQ